MVTEGCVKKETLVCVWGGVPALPVDGHGPLLFVFYNSFIVVLEIELGASPVLGKGSPAEPCLQRLFKGFSQCSCVE